MTRYVYDFTEGDKDQKDLLGGKGANLAEMTRIGLPVPRSLLRPAASIWRLDPLRRS
jgi:phosphoenolpyruvate synthase/pyruvate phosphate dikinase